MLLEIEDNVDQIVINSTEDPVIIINSQYITLAVRPK